MELMEVRKLVSHPRNTEFFDDMVGEPWAAFLESIKTSGVIEPIIATQDLVIVSGHQRVRACKELGIQEVLVDVRVFDSEDEVLKQLIETNIRQRGVGNTNAVKLGRCIKELERIYGIAYGGDRKSRETKLPLISQSELAEQLNISKVQLRKYKSLTDLIPELQDAVQSGQITPTTAMGFVKKLSAEEQEQLAEQISGKPKVTQREIDFYMKQIKDLRAENTALKAKPPEVIEREVIKEVVKEVKPKDYDQLKKDNHLLKADNQRVTRERKQYLDSLNEAQAKLKEYENPDSEKRAQMQLDEDAETFVMNTYSYIKRTGGLVWVTEKMDRLSEIKSKDFIQAVMAIDAFAKQMVANIGGYAVD